MSDALNTLITAQGLAAVLNATQDGLGPVRITHAALGDVGYPIEVNDAGLATATGLQNERERVPILDGQAGAADTQISLAFMADGPADFWVREIGFFLADSTLFALWSHPDKPLAWKSDATPLILALELILSSLPAGSVTVADSTLPVGLMMTRELAIIATALADLQLKQLQLQEQLRTMDKTS